MTGIPVMTFKHVVALSDATMFGRFNHPRLDEVPVFSLRSRFGERHN